MTTEIQPEPEPDGQHDPDSEAWRYMRYFICPFSECWRVEEYDVRASLAKMCPDHENVRMRMLFANRVT